MLRYLWARFAWWAFQATDVKRRPWARFLFVTVPGRVGLALTLNLDGETVTGLHLGRSD